jgi:hypothetical protein
MTASSHATSFGCRAATVNDRPLPTTEPRAQNVRFFSGSSLAIPQSYIITLLLTAFEVLGCWIDIRMGARLVSILVICHRIRGIAIYPAIDELENTRPGQP